MIDPLFYRTHAESCHGSLVDKSVHNFGIKTEKGAAQRKKRLDELLRELGIEHLRKSKAYTLSGGERRRLEITRALVTHPLCILLDEPFSGIDPIAVADCQNLIRELKYKGLGILLTDHNVRETLAITDRAYIMFEGKILISGTKDDLLVSKEARKIYLGDKFTM